MLVASVSATEPISATLSNDSTHPCELFWHDYTGLEVSYGVMLPGETKIINTFVTHPWSVTSNYGAFEIGSGPVWMPCAADNGTTLSVSSDHGENLHDQRWKQTDHMITPADYVYIDIINNSNSIAHLKRFNLMGNPIQVALVNVGLTRSHYPCFNT